MDKEIIIDYIKDIVKTYKDVESNLKMMPEQLSQDELIDMVNKFDDMVVEFESFVELLNEELELKINIKELKWNC